MLLETKNLSKNYGAVVALRSGDLSVRAGEIHALMGANGAGKSTLVKVLTGDVAPNAGVILLEGREVRFASPASARTVADLFPIMRRAEIVRAWSGIESRMPDDIPVIGPSSTSEGVFHQFGFSTHGFQLGPGTGAMMAELVATGSTNTPIGGLEIGRFRP